MSDKNLKLAEAEKLIREHEEMRAKLPNDDDIAYEHALIAAASLISYERGRDDKAKGDVEAIGKILYDRLPMDLGDTSCHALFNEIKKKILNPEAQQALKSDNP